MSDIIGYLDNSRCLPLNSSGSTDNSFESDKCENELLWNVRAIGARGYGPITSTPAHTAYSHGDDLSGYSTVQYEANYCRATIHFLIKNLENTNYTCKICNKSTSLYYSDYDFSNRNVPTSWSDVTSFENITSSPISLINNPTRVIKRKFGVICNFCKKNGEIPLVYQNHELKNAEGKVVCPVLRRYKCEMCNATGDYAHTRKYCPNYVVVNEQLPVFRRLANGVISSTHNHK